MRLPLAVVCGAGLVLVNAAAARAGGGEEDHEVGIGRTAAGRLIAHVGFEQPETLEASIHAGIDGYATGSHGFANIEIDFPDEDMFLLSLSSDIRGVLTYADPGIFVHDGLHVMAVGEEMNFGQPFFDYHPIFHIPDGVPGQHRTLRFKFRDASGLYAESEEVSVSFTPEGCAGDVGEQGGQPGHDGQLDNNDFIVFITMFFQQQEGADRGVQGGVPGVDGQFDNNDFIVFITQFFEGC
ncbi:MAG: GC-type dockerin domain-anchored protein [Phycisphaerales bacterium]